MIYKHTHGRRDASITATIDLPPLTYSRRNRETARRTMNGIIETMDATLRGNQLGPSDPWDTT